ncbi:MAG: sulfotransferase domain-containing protein [Methylococcales bacterium]
MIIRKIKTAWKKFFIFRRKLIWRLGNNYKGRAKPTFICGVQRSGTTMLGECLERSPQVWHYAESDQHAFHDYILRNNQMIKNLIDDSPYQTLVFKPLTDSHRVKDLMSRFGNGVCIWMYRRYEDRANSAVVKFGTHNLEVLSDIANDQNLDIWQAQGLVKEDIELIKSFDYRSMKPEEAATLFWYLRNKLYFNQQLDKDPKVLPVCYEELIQNPEETMRKVCMHLDVPYHSFLIQGIHARSLGKKKAPDIRDEIKDRCDDIYSKLDSIRLAIAS